MKKILLSVSLIVGLVCIGKQVCAQTYDQGIGVRIGDPFGITYKSYFNNKAAIEFTLGTTSANRHGSYHKRSFNNRNKFDSYRYVDHLVDYTVAIQGRVVWHESFPANVEGRLDWYWGIGGHLRYSDIDYSFFDQLDILRRESDTNFDIGPEGILGMEYEFLDYPIVGFGEVSLMGEIIDNPLRFRLFGAIGIRYAF